MSFESNKRKIKIAAYILTAASFLIFALLLTAHIKLEKETLQNGEKFATQSAKEVQSSLDSVLHKISNHAHQSAEEIIEWRSTKNYKIKQWCALESKKNKDLLGVTFTLEPKDSVLYSLYYDNVKSSYMRIDTIYDYTDPTKATSNWYSTTMKRKKGYWSKPYFGSGAKNLITDYNYPFKLKNGQYAVISYTISIQRLSEIIHDYSIGKAGYGLIIDQEGTFISHPIADYILKENIESRIDKTKIVESILKKNSGFINKVIDNQGNEIALAFEQLDNEEWKLITVYSLTDLYTNDQEQKTSLIKLFITGSICFALIFLVILLPRGVSSTESWYYSGIITFVLIANIGFIWYLNLNPKYAKHDNQHHEVTSPDDIGLFVSQQNKKREKFSFKPLTTVPTGISIEKIKYEDTYNVGISGWIWQKYPLNKDIEPGIHFPQLSPFAESNLIEKISDEIEEEYRLVKWRFKSTFIFKFDYRKFPFNTKNIVLKITHPDYGKNVLFTPALDSYKTITPSALPGIIPNTRSSSNFISTRFSFSDEEISGDFGSQSLSELKTMAMMQYEIKTRKPFVNALIKQYIPIFLVGLMIFLLMFNMRRNEKTGKSSVGIETVSGFLFILVLSHIEFRKSIFSSSITYLETFYFVIYFMIAFIAINIVFFNLSKEYFMTKNNNRLLKLSYWPFLYFSILIITLVIFQ